MHTKTYILSTLLFAFCFIAKAQTFTDQYYKYELTKMPVNAHWEPDSFITVAAVSINELFNTKSFGIVEQIEIPGHVSFEGTEYNVVIADNAFAGCAFFNTITIDEGVLRIGDNAFADCKNLTSISIPSTVSYLGFTMLRACNSLKHIHVNENNPYYDSRNNCNAINNGDRLLIGCKTTKIPEGISDIIHEAFLGCEGLTEIDIPEGVQMISRAAFSGCKKLKRISLPESLTDLYDEAFGYCNQLTEVFIPKNIRTIAGNPFAGCNNLKKISVDKANVTFDSRNNCNAIIETKKEKLVAACLNTKMPKGIKEFGSCFSGLNISSVFVPSTVEAISPYAFSYCKFITMMEVDKDNPKYDSRNNCNAIIETGSNSLVAGCYNTVIPKGIIEIREEAFCGRMMPETVNIPFGVELIRKSAFQNCSGIKHVQVPSSVVLFGQRVFENCHSLQSVDFRANISELSAYTFSNCSNLSEVNFTEYVKIIAFCAFYNCSSLTHLSLPKSVKIIEPYAFSGCPCEQEISKLYNKK